MLQYPPPFKYPQPMVAFFGPMASGKTYAAANLFPQYAKYSLAAPLKKTALEYFDVTGKSNNERQILQELADDIKKWDNDVFTKRLLWNIWQDFKYEMVVDPIVCDDLRFTHEARDLRDYGFILVRVDVPEDLRLARIAEKYPDTDPSRFQHKSEKDWKNIKYDYMISGNGEEGLNSLREAISNRVQ